MKKMSFREQLIEVRKSKGLTQTEVADLCNISLRTIQRIEAGKVTPRAYTIKQIAEALDFDFFRAYENPDTNISKKKKSKDTFRNSIEFVKDLFNLKTNTMKKVSILSSFCLLIATSIFLFTNKINAQGPKNTAITIASENELIEPVKVAFTNELTFDELITIKNNLKNKGITIDYKQLTFDDNNKLSAIGCFVDCNDGFNGYFFADNLNSKKKKFGFYRDYDLNAKSPFGTGILKKTIILDVGHGGRDSGVFTEELQEKRITLAIANKVKELSKNNKEIEIFLTRSSDQFISLNKRVEYINNLKADYVISLHVASSGLEEMNGINFFTSNKSEYKDKSTTITESFLTSMSENLKVNTIQNMNSHILKKVECPSTLIELGYLSNPKDKNNLTSEKGQEKIAKAIYKALKTI
ncbi:N-acetylmuramoyl-L-alanine amidase [uncultured Tenacibaculum sp.]|uniref:N-acetylmuramoyl-L-alanine amidase n=1 Tax=uncultured Tenacibaculum sp. TaxID=174713 RepID=UPI00260EB8B6|nr:N-acetylmuramoyl-L-alanine amidase [uncultured Tenacibaculum sp.]